MAITKVSRNLLNTGVVNNTDGGIIISTDGYGRALLLPADENGTAENNLHYIGSSSYRWRDIYLSGSIDFNSTTVFKTNGSERMRIASDGKVFIATTSASRTTAGHEFHTDGFARHTASGDKSLECVRTSSDGEVFEIFKDNTLKQYLGTASNSLFSDKKVKKDIKSLELGLDLIKKLNPTEYRHIIDDDDSPKSFGLIAQEFEKSLKEAGVEKNSTYLLQHKPSEDKAQSDYWLDYQKLTPILIKAIQEQQEIIDDLKTRIEELEA